MHYNSTTRHVANRYIHKNAFTRHYAAFLSFSDPAVLPFWLCVGTPAKSGRRQPGESLHAPELAKPSILSRQKDAKVRLPCSKDENFIATVFLTFQLSKGTIFEMPNRVLIVFSQYKIAFLNMIA